jgi:hypothetical protein
MLEHQKMVTEKGPICYACFNALQEEVYRVEQARRAPETEKINHQSRGTRDKRPRKP